MLTESEIKQRHLIEDADPANYRFATYDVSIAKIVTPSGEQVDSYTLPPMGIVEVISRELFRLPGDICVLAHVKTSLCNEGLLTLNTGIVDPLWNGRVSSFMLNFGKDDRLVLAGEVFLRLSFHQLAAKDGRSLMTYDDRRYVSERRRNMAEKFSPYFLNVQAIIDKSVEANLGKLRDVAFKYVPLGALFMAILTFLLNFGTLSLVQRWVQPNDATRAELLRSSLERSESFLKERIEALESQVKALQPSPSPPAQK